MASLVYEINETVMCKNRAEDNFGYLAKIRNAEKNKDGSFRYHIHYQGWNIRHDTWIEQEGVADMLFKHTPEIEAEHKVLLAESQGKSAKKKVEPTSSMRKRRPDREGSAESGASGVKMSKDSLTLTLPDKLRAILIDDNDLIYRQCKQAKLPSRFTVDHIIKEYCDQLAGRAASEMGANDELLLEYSNGKSTILNKQDMVHSSLGIVDYFNILMGSQLLYKMERDQYTNACVKALLPGAPGQVVDKEVTPELEDIKVVPSSLYGMPHLLRLFVRIGPLLMQGGYSEKILKVITSHITDLMIFLSKNAMKYYDIQQDYEILDKKDEKE